MIPQHNRNRRRSSDGGTDDDEDISEHVQVLCTQIRNIFLDDEKEYARGAVQSTVAAAVEDLRREDEIRLRYLENLDDAGQETANTSMSERTDAASGADKSLQSLEQIVAAALSRKKKERMKPIAIPDVAKMEKYDAWVPLRTNFRAGETLELSAYMPFLGDKDEDLLKAHDIRADMALDETLKDDVSDGSLDSDGNFKELFCQDYGPFAALAARRSRAADRRAIIGVIDEFGELSEQIFRELGKTLDIEPRLRLDKIIKISQERKKERKNESEARKKRRRKREEFNRATRKDYEEPAIPMSRLIEENKLEFCFICHTFHCEQHYKAHYYPVNPIRDLHQEIRLQEIENSNIEPCSNNCHMNQEEGEVPEKGEEWSDSQISILHEYLPLFGNDPCYLAVVVGRSCADVAEKISERENDGVALNTGYNNEKRQSVKKSAANHWKKGKGGKRRKSRDMDNRIVEPDFVPCNHEGDCTVENKCTCVERGHPCEISCGCKNARFCEGVTGKGIARFVDRSRHMGGEHGLCSNLTPGCNCTEGCCDDDRCPCWKNSRACNPDICEGCECNILGSKISSSVQRCRNICPDFSGHKRTIIGKSDVHGYGLFAGEEFTKCELIGLYAGQLLQPKQANVIDYIYDVKKHTFFFDMYENVVIDAGILGSKTKFVNNAAGEENVINCTCRLLRYRGEDRIALYASRDIEAGEEIRFDYKFKGNSPKRKDAEDEEEFEEKPEAKSGSSQETAKSKKDSRQKRRRTPRKTKT